MSVLIGISMYYLDFPKDFVESNHFHSKLLSGKSRSKGNNDSVGFYQQKRHSGLNLLSQTLWNNNQEFCVQYNMLKLIRMLIQWTGAVEYVNAYETIFVNSIWGTQDPSEPGHMLYSYPLGEGVSKPTSVGGGSVGYGTQFDSFWCCYTTAIDQWTKMSDSIYFYQNNPSSLYINLFVSSQLDWTEAKLSLRQMTAFPRETTTNLTFTTVLDQMSMDVYLRVPSRIVSNESWIEINDIRQDIQFIPSTYLHLPKTDWKTNDRIIYNMAMRLHVEPINDNAKLVSILYGPIVLGGLIDQAKVLSNDTSSIRKVNRTSDEPLLFETSALDGTTFQLLPLYEIIHQTYTVYFPIQ